MMAERESECPICPSFVRCAHYKDLALWLSDNAASPAIPGHRSANTFCVSGPETPAPCRRSRCPGHLVMGEWSSNAVEFPDLPAAEAEFSRREALLLGREVPA
ncbi:hypothetical protein LCGC14_2731950 [marine sediment metagenome]|uniref:Uncharacterized protein n=1 Tax=marine sediment metagenome TaxID=412755 RepID=A0A0F8Z729_9ZZZZ